MKNNLEEAISIILEKKQENNTLKFRMETCISKESVKVYVIQRDSILEIITIENGVAVFEEK